MNWSSVARFLVKWAPAVVEAIFKAKSAADSKKKPVAEVPPPNLTGQP
jgi:hypothetical protein